MRYRRSKMTAAAGGIIATALAIGMLASPSAHADASGDAVPTTGAVFNDPTGTEDEQYAIRDHIMNLVESTEPGETVSMSLANVTDDEREFADSLVAAADRGVKVRAVLNGPTSDTGSAKAIVDGLGTDKDKDSWAIVCSSGCHGSKINHNKFYIFSNVGGKEDVVVQSSANFTISNSKSFWNNAVTFVGNTKLYNGYADYFKDLARDKKDSSYYTTHKAGDVKSYHFPRSGKGDTVANTLGNVACGSDDDPTRIRMGMWYFGRPAVANELVRLGKAGCKVQIAYTRMTDKVESILSPAANVTMRQLPDGSDYIIHSKYYLIDGPYVDVDRKVVFTGSHNISQSALHKNDETLMRIYSEEIHDQYAENFDNIFDTNGGNGNPYSPKQACGSNYSVIDKHALKDDGDKVGTVYLLYASGKNCVVTMKNTKIGEASKVTSTLQVKGETETDDSGEFDYYAGPVKKSANKTCVKWGGSAAGVSFTSDWSHCD